MSIEHKKLLHAGKSNCARSWLYSAMEYHPNLDWRYYERICSHMYYVRKNHYMKIKWTALLSLHSFIPLQLLLHGVCIMQH